ncbi:hypothetical protein AVEN_145048-1 [Araneus ventricosus]|uniref:Uncharacterized protein n=1 Tax=Araneus ventricosus TaxID=182803 RepID=A0A4Y2SI79_ARAVE|nr:hypothetical protein AVEN_145048-1 [Araneus ventricosus]
MFQTRYLYFFSPPPELPYHTISTRSNGRRWFPRWEVVPLYVFTSGRVSQQKSQREEDMWKAQLLMHCGIYLNAGPTCLTRRGRNQVLSIVPVSRELFSQHSLKKIFLQISVWNLDLVPNLGCGWEGDAPDFALDISKQFFSFASSMDIFMQEDDTITQHAKAFPADNFTMAQ